MGKTHTMGSQGLILIVDDSSIHREYYRRVLEWAGFDVMTVADGTHALPLMETQTFDLVLSDIKMPNLDGYELYARVSESKDIAGVPFLFVTDYYSSSGVQRFGHLIGAGPHLTKPVKPTDLVEAVSRYKRQVYSMLQNMHQS